MSESKLDTNGFSKWEKYILISIEDLKKQYDEAEDKIDKNRDKFIEAVNALAITVTEEVGDLRADIKLINQKITQRAMAVGAIAGGVPATVMLIWMLFKLRIGV